MQVGWAAEAVQRSIKVRYYVKMAAGKVVVKWIQLCYNLRTATCTFFQQSREMKISLDENRLVEVLQESYDILAYERCSNYQVKHWSQTCLCRVHRSRPLPQIMITTSDGCSAAACVKYEHQMHEKT